MIQLSLKGLRYKFVVVMLLLLCVITVFVSPIVDLQPTALRALKHAKVLCARVRVPLEPITTIVERHFVLSLPPDLLELNCARLC